MKENFTVAYGSAVTVFPREAVKLIINGAATQSDTRVLAALLSAKDSGKASGVATLCAQTGLDENEVAHALSFWRGAGIITIKDSVSAEVDSVSSVKPSEPEPCKPEVSHIEPTPAEPAATPEQPKKVLLSRETRHYTGIEISEMLERDGGKLREMIDSCQQLIGHIFTPSETQILLGLTDWLGLDAEYVMTLVAYYVTKKPACSPKYLEKVAVDLVNDGIHTLDDLDLYIKNLEIYDGVAGQLRSLIGIGARAYTKKENGCITHWVKELGYGFDIIKLAYEICCDAKGSFNFDYAGKVLDNWYLAGVRSASEAEAETQRFREAKASAPSKGSDLAKSFDSGEFFNTALKRSYENMAKK